MNAQSLQDNLPSTTTVFAVPDAGWFLPLPLFKINDTKHVSVSQQVCVRVALRCLGNLS